MPVVTGIIAGATAVAQAGIAAIGAVGGALGIGGGIGGFLTVARVVIGIASIGYSFVQQSMARQKQKKQQRLEALAGGATTGEAALQTITAPIITQRMVYGTVRTGGGTFFFEDIPPYRIVGLALAAHEVDGFDEVTINGNVLVLDAAGFATNAPYTRPDGRQLLRVSLRKGTVNQAVDPIIIQRARWVGPSFRQQETATIVVEANYGNSDTEYQEVWPGGALEIVVKVRGKKVFDPTDPSQSLTDPSTWKWSDSPSLCCADFMTWDDKFGVKLKKQRLDLVKLAQSASIDREMVITRTGQYERRYTVNGVIDTDISGEDAIRSFLTANRGRISDQNGQIGIIAGRYTDPVMTIHQGLLTGGFSYRAGLPRKDAINLLRTRFVDPARQYQVSDGPVLESAARQIRDGGVYETTLEFALVEGSSRVQRLGKAAFEDAELGRVIKNPVSMACFRLESGDNIQIDFPDAPHCNGVYSVESVELNKDLSGVSLTLVETGPQIYAFNPTIDDKPFAFEVITRT